MEKNKIWWIFILFVGIMSYGYGLFSAKYHIFPYKQIRYFKNVIIAYNNEHAHSKNSVTAGQKKQVASYYQNKISFFKVNGSRADIVMIGDSITDYAEWSELFPNKKIANRGIGGDTTKGVYHDWYQRFVKRRFGE